ncbi:winged helix-turn-helix transcriptional regulator [Gluconobacter japonicus]|uniref:winged helix-turn-helix transcriptional regulator n=1 Tax=Gluconobacter japonicus TaxID=376620 RepID=UPI00078522BB|nr:helix-turn-helix domain-containing protein [Gluconobacter japonicus]KXV28687.1 integrase [Gluconobacter japonicus]
MTRSLPEHYRQAPFDEDCAPRRVLRLFSGKWTTMILHTLHLLGGHSRPGQLQRSIPGLSKKMMTQTLRELEDKGLVSREIHQIMPPNVDYSLTPLGKIFVEPIEQLYLWGIDHADALEALEANERLAGTTTDPLEAAE